MSDAASSLPTAPHPRAGRRPVRPCSRTRFSFTAISERLGEQGTFTLIQPIYELMAGAVNDGSVKDCGPFATCKAFFGVLPNLSIFFEPERRNSRNFTFLYLHVSHILNNTKYSRRPVTVVFPSITSRNLANVLTACSALL